MPAYPYPSLDDLSTILFTSNGYRFFNGYAVPSNERIFYSIHAADVDGSFRALVFSGALPGAFIFPLELPFLLERFSLLLPEPSFGNPGVVQFFQFLRAMTLNVLDAAGTLMSDESGPYAFGVQVWFVRQSGDWPPGRYDIYLAEPSSSQGILTITNRVKVGSVEIFVGGTDASLPCPMELPWFAFSSGGNGMVADWLRPWVADENGNALANDTGYPGLLSIYRRLMGTEELGVIPSTSLMDDIVDVLRKLRNRIPNLTAWRISITGTRTGTLDTSLPVNGVPYNHYGQVRWRVPDVGLERGEWQWIRSRQYIYVDVLPGRYSVADVVLEVSLFGGLSYVASPLDLGETLE